eukprot:1151365-Pelagomonas_calceolata.AAC.7
MHTKTDAHQWMLAEGRCIHVKGHLDLTTTILMHKQEPNWHLSQSAAKLTGRPNMEAGASAASRARRMYKPKPLCIVQTQIGFHVPPTSEGCGQAAGAAGLHLPNYGFRPGLDDPEILSRCLRNT